MALWQFIVAWSLILSIQSRLQVATSYPQTERSEHLLQRLNRTMGLLGVRFQARFSLHTSKHAKEMK